MDTQKIHELSSMCGARLHPHGEEHTRHHTETCTLSHIMMVVRSNGEGGHIRAGIKAADQGPMASATRVQRSQH
eukprot:37351-Eustigmatos_ZCMA.PRE.1